VRNQFRGWNCAKLICKNTPNKNLSVDSEHQKKQSNLLLPVVTLDTDFVKYLAGWADNHVLIGQAIHSLSRLRGTFSSGPTMEIT